MNPFTASLAVPSLGKPPIKMPDSKLLGRYAPFTGARERTSIEMHSVESTFVTGPSDILFAGVQVCTFDFNS